VTSSPASLVQGATAPKALSPHWVCIAPKANSALEAQHCPILALRLLGTTALRARFRPMAPSVLLASLVQEAQQTRRLAQSVLDTSVPEGQPLVKGPSAPLDLTVQEQQQCP